MKLDECSREQVSVSSLRKMSDRGEKITAVTAYDYTFASYAEAAGIDIVLVGDSLASTVQGLENTLPVTLDEMIYHTRLVTRACKKSFVVCDMPFMSYQIGEKEALASAGRIVKESNAKAVKLEGGQEISQVVSRLVSAGIPVMGHIGLTPQSVNVMGGYKIQGKTQENAKRLLSDAKALEAAGVFSIVLEGMPDEVASKITKSVNIPTIGIGAGVTCSGQILVMHDLLGLTVRNSELRPKFVKEFAAIGKDILSALSQYKKEVSHSKFPGKEHTYVIPQKEETSRIKAFSKQ